MTAQKQILFLILLIGLALRLSYLVHLLPICRADEAVFGLMTKHLMEGKDLPIYLYRAHYAGALICYPAAILFSLFGISMSLLKLTTYLFTLPTIIFIYLLSGALMGPQAALLSSLFFAFPPFLINWTGQYAGGGYPETLFFGAAVLLLTHRLLSGASPSQERHLTALLGFLNGFGTWILFSMIPYTLTMWTLVLQSRNMKKSLARLFAIFMFFYVIGISPMILYNVRHPLATFMRLGANVLHLEKSEISGKETGELVSLGLTKLASKIGRLPQDLLQVSRNVLEALQLDRSFGRLAGILNFFQGLALLFLFWCGVRNRKTLKIPWVLMVWMIFFLAATGLTKARYVSFLYPALAIFLGCSLSQLSRRRALWILSAALFLSANLLNHIVALRTPDEEDQFTELVSFLESRNFRYGYTDYATAYPINFLTGEDIICSPTAGPLNVERYPPYTEKVDQAEETFFIFGKASLASSRFEEALHRKGISFESEGVGRHTVYYHLSRRVYPRELPLIRFFPAD